jgi:hypothetical protein
MARRAGGAPFVVSARKNDAGRREARHRTKIAIKPQVEGDLQVATATAEYRSRQTEDNARENRLVL